MIDYVIMGGISLFLILLLVLGAKFMPDGNDKFFDQQNSKAMRGFWCLIVILVHIPQGYQNTIQDMIGSFAYIGVTFFFMTSGYGLSVSSNKKTSAGAFWLNRLPKVLVPNWITNIIFALILVFVCGLEMGVLSYIGINIWVQWLLVCYLIFWIGNIIIHSRKYSMAIVITLTVLFSICVYYLKHIGIITATTWCTEIIGFVWGVLLCSQYDRIKGFFLKKWLAKTILLCACSLILGVMYLMFKPVIFWGDYLLKIVLGLSILCFVLILNSKFSLGNKLSYFFGDISFEVYLVHVAVSTLISTIFPSIGSGLFVLSVIVISVISAALMHKISSTVLRLGKRTSR